MSPPQTKVNIQFNNLNTLSQIKSPGEKKGGKTPSTIIVQHVTLKSIYLNLLMPF